MSQKKNEIKSWSELIKALFTDDNWYLGGFIVLLLLFVIFDLIVFTPHA
ncbi:hypothetical protein V6M85_05285 [Sulfolobus tengchongensis]|uniref:Uncharacterized protein n=2 Tax=Sulfolobus tengchongensis TaxID=207809 RepID=A0AAX4L300_9CREN